MYTIETKEVAHLFTYNMFEQLNCYR